MDLIDREDAINAIDHRLPYVSRKRATIMLHEVQGMDLVRCKDCKYYEPKDRNFSCNMFSDLGSANNDDDFCAWGEGREE